MTTQDHIDKLLFDYDLIETDKNCLNNISGAISDAITIGRKSVLDDFDTVCKADVFMGLSDEQWYGVKLFFKINNQLTNRNHD